MKSNSGDKPLSKLSKTKDGTVFLALLLASLVGVFCLGEGIL